MEFKIGDRVQFLYPNARLGCGQIIGISADPKRKPLIIQFDNGDLAYAHTYQVEVAS